jgi:hypothetical protein
VFYVNDTCKGALIQRVPAVTVKLQYTTHRCTLMRRYKCRFACVRKRKIGRETNGHKK